MVMEKGKGSTTIEHPDQKDIQPQGKYAPMEEDEDFTSLEGLYLIAMEDACHQDETKTIPNKQIHIIVTTLQKAKAKMQLGVKTITTQDGKKSGK